MNHCVTISKRRKAELERELWYLQTTRSREVEMMIMEAKLWADPADNSEYDAAMAEQDWLCRRMEEIASILDHAVVVEGKHLSDEFIAELTKRIEACGLSPAQAEVYVKYCRDGYELREEEKWGILPSEECFQTLKEAQNMISKKRGNWSISESEIAKLLQTPSSQWQQTKQAITECFGCSNDTVDVMFQEEVQLLLVTADSVYAFADYLKSVFTDEAIIWKIYQNAVLLGLESTRNRITSVLDTLGEEFGHKVILADVENDCWLFYRYYTDPAGAIAYMKDFGLTSEKILTVVRENPHILYLYKEREKRSYGHDQERIDNLLRGYL